MNADMGAAAAAAAAAKELQAQSKHAGVFNLTAQKIEIISFKMSGRNERCGHTLSCGAETARKAAEQDDFIMQLTF